MDIGSMYCVAQILYLLLFLCIDFKAVNIRLINFVT